MPQTPSRSPTRGRFAEEFQTLDPQIAHARERMRHEMSDRYGFDPDAPVDERAVKECRQAVEASTAIAAADREQHRAARPTERYDTPRRREQLAATLTAAGIDQDAVHARAGAGTSFGTPAEEAVTHRGRAAEERSRSSAAPRRDLHRER